MANIQELKDFLAYAEKYNLMNEEVIKVWEMFKNHVLPDPPKEVVIEI